MDIKIKFRELLSEVQAAAEAQGKEITTSEIHGLLEDIALSEEQFQLIYQYLLQKAIKIPDYEEPTQDREPISKKLEEAEETVEPEEDQFLNMYLEEISQIEPLSEEEEVILYASAEAGDSIAKTRLIESHLWTVLETAKEHARRYPNMLLSLGDLIQEGNVGLMLAMDMLAERPTGSDVKEYIEDSIRESMQMAISFADDEKQAGKKIAEKAEFLQSAISNLEEDLGEKVSLPEISAYLDMSMEELEEVLRLAGEDLKEQLKKE